MLFTQTIHVLHRVSFPLPLQTEHLISLYWGDSSSVAAAEAAAWRYSDSNRSFMERQYRLDRPQFKSLYGLLVPWLSDPKQHTDTTANRTFTLLDQDSDNLVTFREFAGWLGRWRRQHIAECI